MNVVVFRELKDFDENLYGSTAVAGCDEMDCVARMAKGMMDTELLDRVALRVPPHRR